MAKLQSEQPKLIFWLPAVNPYWARRFSQLEASGRVRFECWFNAERGTGRDWVVPDTDMTFPYVFLPRGHLARNVAVLKRWMRMKPTRILTFHFDPKLWPSLILTIGSRRVLAFYIEKTWDSWIARTWLKEQLKHVLFRRADTVFCPGEDAVRYVRKYRPSGSFRKLPHVVDVGGLSTAIEMRTERSGLRLLYLGRFVPEKGIADLMAAVDSLSADSGVSVSFVGSGPLLASLEEWASTSILPVTIEGFVQQTEIVPVLAAADVLVFPTHGDPYGLVVDEALASGMPVISSSAAGEITSRLVAGPGRPRGVIVQPGDPSALADAICRLAADRGLVDSMKVAAAEYACSHSKIEDWVCAIEQWCDETQSTSRI